MPVKAKALKELLPRRLVDPGRQVPVNGSKLGIINTTLSLCREERQAGDLHIFAGEMRLQLVVDTFPAEDMLQVLGERPLDEAVFSNIIDEGTRAVDACRGL